MAAKDYLDCYTRVSTTEQAKSGNSLVVQKELGQKVAKDLGLEFRHRDEGATSSTLKNRKKDGIEFHYREALEEIKEDISRGKVKNIWVQDRSRMFRDMTDGLLFRRDYLERYQVTLYEGDGIKIDFNNEDDSVMYDIITRLQQYENKKRVEKSQRGKIAKLEKAVKTNKAMFIGGSALFGYENIDKQWHIDKEKAKWVRHIFDAYEKGQSVKQIKDYLDKSGVETTRTKTGLWCLGTIQKMLANEAYTGLHRVHIKKVDRTYALKVPAIIKVSQFRKVKKAMEHNNKHKTNAKKHKSLLAGLLYCECGTRMASHHQQYTKGTGQLVNQKKYFCRSKEEAWKHSKISECKNTKALTMDEADNFIIDVVIDVVKNSSLLKENTKKAVLREKEQVEGNYLEEKERIEKKIQRIQTQLEHIENQITEVEVQKGLDQKQAKIKVADKILERYWSVHEAQSDELKNCETALDKLDDNLVWVDWVGKFSDELEVKTRSFEGKEEFLKGLLDKIIVSAEFDENRDKVVKQQGHSFKLMFNLALVDDKVVYTDEKNKRLGYDVKGGKKSLKTDMVRDVTARSGVYERKKKEQKMQ
jgi:site-specific DNA recombinase